MPSLAKPEIEFTPVTDSKGVFSSSVTSRSNADGTFTNYRTYLLSHDSTTGDTTILKEHSPGSVWGGNPRDNFDKDTVCSHDYWEECYIIEGRLYDVGKKQWFAAGSYCCRPPGMLHGPCRADEKVGCREICTARYEHK
jgi:hypothetical protein